MLLKLYLYGHPQRIRSGRRLEAESPRDPEVIWLTENLRPDHRMIAAFRREHRARVKAVLREFTLICRELDLFGAELVAIDGATFKALNRAKRRCTAAQPPDLIAGRAAPPAARPAHPVFRRRAPSALAP